MALDIQKQIGKTERNYGSLNLMMGFLYLIFAVVEFLCIFLWSNVGEDLFLSWFLAISCSGLACYGLTKGIIGFIQYCKDYENDGTLKRHHRNTNKV